MIAKKVWGTIGLVGLVGLMGQTLLLTGKLASLDAVLGQNLIQVKQLVAVQRSMLIRNQTLPKTLKTSQGVQVALTTANRSASQIGGLIAELVMVNAKNLAENQGIDSASAVAAMTVKAIGQELAIVNGQTQGVTRQLQYLEQVALSERGQLQTLLVNTKTIEERTP